MKRLIDGVTYNTDTATLLARSDYEGDWNNNKYPVEGELFQTRGGAFFIVEEIAIGERRSPDCGPSVTSSTLCAAKPVGMEEHRIAARWLRGQSSAADPPGWYRSDRNKKSQ